MIQLSRLTGLVLLFAAGTGCVTPGLMLSGSWETDRQFKDNAADYTALTFAPDYTYTSVIRREGQVQTWTGMWQPQLTTTMWFQDPLSDYTKFPASDFDTTPENRLLADGFLILEDGEQLNSYRIEVEASIQDGAWIFTDPHLILHNKQSGETVTLYRVQGNSTWPLLSMMPTSR
ncbi:MAG: hypothetical protein VX527_03610 [Planctomycetota bacterium]|nr:hypothetical protein [Planctomycetota bacterium]